MKLSNSKRPRRANIGTRNVLTVNGKDPAYEYRVVNDVGDRISQFQEMGYEIVTDPKISVGDRRIANPTAEGSPVKVSVGGGTQGYVMRIKKEWYDEDQAAKQELPDRIEQAMRREAKESSDFGNVSIGNKS
jgi:hypothetical protein